MRSRAWIALLLSGLVAGMLFPAAASAETVVPVGHAVVEVTAIGQDVTLNGTSKGSVIVIDGDLTIGPHGRALHGVTLIGGHLITRPGAEIQGDVLQIGGSVPAPTGWILIGALVAALLFRSVAVWVVFRLARIMAARPTTGAIFAAARPRPLRTAVVGALMLAGALAAAILLTLTVIGIVLAAALAGAVVLASIVGVAFAVAPLPEQADHRTVLVALLFPLIGDALLAVAAIVGMGALVHYMVAERRPPTLALSGP